MYRLTRTSTTPASPLKIMISRPDGQDAGLTAGGSFVLDPGDSVQVDAYVAGVIMGDPDLATHFECLPTWVLSDQTEAPVTADELAAEQPAAVEQPERSKWEPAPRKRGR